MTKTKVFTRRDFTVSSALAILGGVTITLSGCGDSSSPVQPTSTTPPPATPPAPTGNITGVVGTNHGHNAVISAAELTSTSTITIDIQGTSSHPHTVDLTPAELGQIAAGNRVSKTSSNDAAHTHSVTFN